MVELFGVTKYIFTMLLTRGTRLGHYEIVGPIGAGGMGEVYRPGIRSLAGTSRFGANAYNPEWSPDGEKLAFWYRRELWVVPRAGGQAKNLVSIGPHTNRLVSRWRDPGVRIRRGGATHEWTGRNAALVPGRAAHLFHGALERAGNILAFSFEDRTESVVSDLRGRAGTLEAYALATDGAFVYFSWAEDMGDGWVMDVLDD